MAWTHAQVLGENHLHKVILSEVFQQYKKLTPIFKKKLVLILLKFSMIILFNIQQHLHHKAKHYDTTLSIIKSFQTLPSAWWGCVMNWKISTRQTNKTYNLPS
jgi:hypothetical protein